MLTDSSNSASSSQNAAGVSSETGSLLKMMGDKMDDLLAKVAPDKSKWREELPHVRVKSVYADHAPLEKKKEGGNYTWSDNLKSDKVELTDFAERLTKGLDKEKDRAGDLVRGAARMLGALECTVISVCRSVYTAADC